MADRFGSWSELIRANTEGHDFLRHEDTRAPRWLVAAPHGGGIEPGTTEIARSIASTDLSFYSIEGIKQVGNRELHLTSHRFDEPRFLAQAARHEQVLAVHGCEDGRPADLSIWVGGADIQLRDQAIRLFASRGYPAKLDTFTPGAEPGNLCNRGRRGGLQLELSRAFRERLFEALDRVGRRNSTSEFVDFVAVARGLLVGAA